jgi:hypothetical protein
VLWALGIKDLVQHPYVALLHAVGPSRRGPYSMHFVSWPHVLALIRLLVPFFLRHVGCRIRVVDEVLGLFISGDVNVHLSKKLFRGGWSFMEDGSDESRVIRPTVEVLDHGNLRDIGDAIPHSFETLQELVEGLLGMETIMEHPIVRSLSYFR